MFTNESFARRASGSFFSRAIMLPLLLAMLFVQAYAGTSMAASIDIEIINDQAIAGEELAFALTFSLEDEGETIDVSQAVYNGKPLAYQVRSRSTSSFTMVINGKTVQSSSDVEKQYIFSIPTESPGELTIPQFTVYVADKEYVIKPLTFKVLPKPTSDNLKMFVEIVNRQPSYYPSQVIELQCKILYRDFPGSPSIENISLPILRNMAFELLPETNPDVELIINQERMAVKKSQGTENYNGNPYKFFAFMLKFRLMSAGEFAFNNDLKMIIETGKRYRQRTLFFGSEVVKETTPLFAESAPLKINVQELPKDNVPNSFNGAIGNFKIKVTPSSDTAIRVGDPITLLIEISGRGTWEFVKSPPIYKEPQITDYFIVSQEPVIGEVNEANTVKSFSVRLRVKSKTVKEIPPIPFTYFNLSTRKYVTVYSEPVPITVFDATTTARVIDFGEKAESPAETAKALSSEPDKTVAPAKAPEDRQHKLLPPLIQIADNVPTVMTIENHAPVYKKLLLAVAFIVLVLILAAATLYRSREVSERKAAQIKSKKAYKHFLDEIQKLDTGTPQLTSLYSALGQHIQIYLEERFDCKIINLDEETLQPVLESHKIDTEVARQLYNLIDKVDHYRYSPATAGKDEVFQLIELSKKTIKQCDQ